MHGTYVKKKNIITMLQFRPNHVTVIEYSFTEYSHHELDQFWRGKTI
jgi:hypothetical protein